MAAVHYHKCRKCGNVWGHEANPNWTEKDAKKAHTCTKCGAHGSSHYNYYHPTPEEKQAIKAASKGG